MAWDTVKDIRFKCRECYTYHIFSPHEIERRALVQEKLRVLDQFFQRHPENKINDFPAADEKTLLLQQNRVLCLQLLEACQKCDRSSARVSREIIQLQ